VNNETGKNNNYFSQNLSFLKASYPSLYRDLHAVSGMPRFEKAKKGGLTIKLEGVYIESRFDPENESRKLFGKLQTRPAGFFVFLGTGLGYHINFLLEDEGAGGMLIEQSREIFRASLFIIRPDVLRRIVPFVGVDVKPGEIGALLTEDALVVSHRRSIQGRERYYSRAGSLIKNCIREIEASRLTEERTKKLWLKNVLKNYSSACMLRSSGRKNIDDTSGGRRIYGSGCLRSLFRGPAVLVASGPFLEEAEDRLQELGKEVPVISLLPSVSYLIQRGIVPDFVVSTDAGFWNRYRLFSALASLETVNSPASQQIEKSHFQKTSARVPLIAALSVDRSIIRMWPGDVYVFSHGLPVEKEMKRTASRLLMVPMQGTSAIVMILIARMMGFSPLYLAGFDFAIQGLKDHHRGAGFDEYLDVHASRLETRQTFAAERLRSELPAESKDSEGYRIFTTHKLKLYRNWFEQELNLKDLLRLNRGLPVPGLKEEATDKNRGNIFKGEKGIKRASFQDKARTANRHKSQTLKQERIQKLMIDVKQGLDRGNAAADLSDLKKRIFGYIKARKSDGSAASMAYRIFYGEIPSGLKTEEIEREILEAVQELNRACRAAGVQCRY